MTTFLFLVSLAIVDVRFFLNGLWRFNWKCEKIQEENLLTQHKKKNVYNELNEYINSNKIADLFLF